jgi:hypothetical protein
MLAWALWLAAMGCCVAGLVVALLVARPLTAQVLLDGALFAVARSGTPPSGWSSACGGLPTQSAGCTPPRR